MKGLGGKLGARLEELGASTTGAVAALPWETLVEHMGTKARWVRHVQDNHCRMIIHGWWSLVDNTHKLAGQHVKTLFGVDSSAVSKVPTGPQLVTNVNTHFCELFVSMSRWCYNIVRGVDDDAVTPRDKVKSINSCKSFNPTSELSVVRQWLEVLAQELAERMAEDEEEHARRARCLGEDCQLGAA